MNVGVCTECNEILAVGPFNPKIPPTHRIGGQVHTGKVVELPNDPMEPDETPTDYLERLKKTYKDQLFK